MLKTKVICTLGPASDDGAILRGLIESGMDVARFNFSHGAHAEHRARLERHRAMCEELGAVVPVMLDTKGPEVRLGTFPEGGVDLAEGQTYVLTSEECPCTADRACVSYKDLPGDVRPGNKILIDDGLVALEVASVEGQDIVCRVKNAGRISSRKSVNVPGVRLNLQSLTEKDREDILFAIENDFDFIAVSFVRRKEDITGIEHFLKEHNGEFIKLIAKIENREGVDNLSDIINVSDGIMIARGDLGVEIPFEEIPILQKDMIKQCSRAGKPVITATQMLDSMMRNPRPTRAEVTDVANAVFDGTSAVMLSGETAAGKYPIEALRAMKTVARTTEQSIHYWKRFKTQETGDTSSIQNAISHATCTTAMDLSASAIVAVTHSGYTARKISAFRPQCPIIATTANRKIYSQLRLSWGVLPMLVPPVESTDDLFANSLVAAKKSGVVADGDLIVVTAGVPVGISGTTNMLRVQMVGNVLCRGRGYGRGSVTGALFVLNGAIGANQFTRGSILVTSDITDETLPLIGQSSAVIMCGADRSGRADTLSKVLGIPIITGASGAVELLKSGTVVTVDAEAGIVSCVE